MNFSLKLNTVIFIEETVKSNKTPCCLVNNTLFFFYCMLTHRMCIFQVSEIQAPPLKVVTIGDVIIGSLSCCILQTRKLMTPINFFC